MATLALTTRRSGTDDLHSGDFEGPSGPVDVAVRARLEPGTFIYRGSGDAHLRGQHCHLANQAEGDAGERWVIMACGCSLRVPWWTLEPCSC